MTVVPAPEIDHLATERFAPLRIVVAPPANKNVPAPVIAPAKLFDGPANDSVPEATVTVPVSMNEAVIALVPAPPVFSNRPAFLM